jgi:hypothetical protein
MLVALRNRKLGLNTFAYSGAANGVRYLRWGGDGEAVQPEKG